jgi:hypothetical protein
MKIKKITSDVQIIIKNKEQLTEDQIGFILKTMYPNIGEGFDIIDEDQDWEDNQYIYVILFTVDGDAEDLNFKHKVLFQAVEGE